MIFAQNLDSEFPLSVSRYSAFSTSNDDLVRKLLTKHIPAAYQQQIHHLRTMELEVIRRRKALVLKFASEFAPIAEALIPQLQSLHPEEFI